MMLLCIGVSTFCDWGGGGGEGANHKSHAMTSSETSIKEFFEWGQKYLKWKIRSRGLVLATGPSPAGGQGGNAPPIFFLPPNGIFLGGRSCCYWAEKTLKFAILEPLDFGEDLYLFIYFLEITCFWSENLRFRSEKAFGFRRRPFFLWRSPVISARKIRRKPLPF